ncbi:Tyrosine-protein kinase, catalytic domain [Sesbania bispinosa]|nr:Tyrosine-protein kinase, catalytic domain [Sesbania bispinosa]
MAPDSNVTLSSPGVVASTSALSASSNYDPLYKTARIFTASLNYTIKGVQGNYFVRFHFCPFETNDYNVNESSFGVVVNGLKLLSEFDVPGKISHKNMNLQSSGKNSSSFFLIKEYILAVDADMLVIEFVPTGSSFGFINAIEIVPVVGELFSGSVSKVGGSGGSINLNGREMETMYRLNVGGPEIESNEDPNLWRTWEVDSSYMITENAGSAIKNSSNITYASMNDTSVAPLLVYETARAMSNTQVLDKRFNMSWKFEVDPDFDYLVRLHFCELMYDKSNERIFRIYINNRTAADNFDIFVRAGGMNKAYHQDHFDSASSRIDTLWVQLGPDTAAGAAGTDALLNGLEIFKLSRNGNLAYVERYNSADNSVSKSKARIWVGIGAGLASVAVIACIVVLVFCFCRRRKKESNDTKNNSPGWRPLFLYGGAAVNSTVGAKGSAGTQKLYGSVASTRVGKRFTLAEITAATNNFDDSLVIGVGGFGKVYKGEIEDGVPAAIKRANPQSEQGLAEFETEIEMLSKLRHRHLVSLIAVINPTLPKDQINLAEWAMRWQRQRSLDKIIDPHLKGNYCPESLSKFGEIAEKCLADDGKSRPTMGEVLWHLEYVLQLHEAWLNMNNTETSFSSSQAISGPKDGGLEVMQEPSSQDEEVGLDLKQTTDGGGDKEVNAAI